MKNSTFTNFSYNSPVKPSKEDYQQQSNYQNQECGKNISMTPIIKSDKITNKKGESQTDSKLNKNEDHFKTQRMQINMKQNSLYQEDDQITKPGYLRHTNTSEAGLLTQGHNQQFNVKQSSNVITETPFKPRSKKTSQNVNASCLPNIFSDQDEYIFMRQQQQANVEGLVIDSKLHPNGGINKNYQSSRITLYNQINEQSKKKNQIRIRSSQNQDSQKYILGEEQQIVGSKPIHYRVERQTKSNDQRYTNNVKKAIRVQLNKNPALAASLEIYTNGNQQSLQQITKGVQPYIINQFLQKRKNMLQKKVNSTNHSANNRRGQNNSLQQRNDAIIYQNIKNGYSNNSFNSFLNKSQILDENQAINTTSYSQTQKLTQAKYQNQIKQNNIQANNIVINNQTNTTNLNALLSEYRNNSGQQRLLLQDFYNQQGIKDPEFSQKQQSLIDQYNPSKQTLNEKTRSDSPKRLTPSNTNNQQFVLGQSAKEVKNNQNKTIEKDQDRYEESFSNISYVQNFMDNAYGGFQENEIQGQSNNSFLTQSISSNRKLNNNSNSKASLLQKNTSQQTKEATDTTNMDQNADQQTKNQKQKNQVMIQNPSGEGERTQQHINLNGSPHSKRNANSSNQNSPIIDFQNINSSNNNKSADQTLSPIKNSKGDKNQSSLIQQRIVLQQQKRRGNSFNQAKGGTFSLTGSGDASFDLNLICGGDKNNNISNNNAQHNTSNTRQFDFYENKSYYQQNMFSPPRIHKTKAVYVHSNTLSNQTDINKFTNLEEYNFLNEDQCEKRAQSNPRAVISSIPNDQVLLIKSQVPEPQQQNFDIKANAVTSVYTAQQKLPDGIYTCYFQRGNNSGLVRRVLLTRSNWRESPVYSSNLNFRWHPFSKGIKFESLSLHKKRIVNHFEYHAEITTKNGIIKNIGRYCSERGLNIFDFTPTTFLFSLKEKFWDLDLIRFCDFFYKNLPEPLKNQNEYKKNYIEIKSKFRQIQIRTNNQKSNKKKQIGIVAPPGLDKYGEMKIHNTFLGDSQSSYIWLLKPTNLNRGRGIELFSNLFQLETLLNSYFDGFYEQPIQNKVQPNEEKQAVQQQQDVLLNIAMAQSIANQENKQDDDQKQKEEPILKNLFDKSLYVTPNNMEKEEEKGKKIDQIKKSSNKNNDNEKNLENKQLLNKNSDSKDEKEIEATPNQLQSDAQNQVDQIENEQTKEQDSPKKNEESETENKAKKQKIKKNKASNSNQNVNYNNNIHISRLKDLSLPKKPIIITSATTNSNTNSSNNQNKQPNSPEKKNNKNSNGISAEFGGYLMKEHSFVIQKYIEKPFLINERKFDIRMWVLVNQNMDVYLFKEGYIRTSSKKYDVSDQDDIFIHLTNNAIQKYSDSYGQYENGNQLSLNNFDEYLKIKGYKQTFRGDIMPRIKEIITISMLSVKNKLNANDRKFSFELFGYDFFIDQQFNVWLIEINTNPCIEESSPLLEMLIPRMIDDALKLSVDLIFPPQYSEDLIQKQIQKYSSNSKEKKNQNFDNNNHSQNGGEIQSSNCRKGLIESLFPVTGYSSQENMFQFLVNLYKSN